MLKHNMHQKQSGFTLIELLVVLAIIGLMAAIATVSYGVARDKSRNGKAQGDIKQLYTASEQMGIDTSKRPGGCAFSQTAAGVMILLNSANSGLETQPTVGTTVSPCAWTTTDIAGWKGPYLSSSTMLDPWGTAYYFDMGYQTGTSTIAALVSWGKNKLVGTYDSDNIYLQLK